MLSKEIIDFFKRHNIYEEDMFDYIEEHTDFVDYNDEEVKTYIGTAYAIDKKTGKLIRFRVCVPYNVDCKTALINIHEIVHGIVGYKHLNKSFKKDIHIEALAFLYEKLYIMESNNPELERYGLYLDSLIDENSEESYKYALYVREYLINNYNKDFNKMDRLSISLAKKYKKSNK